MPYQTKDLNKQYDQWQENTEENNESYPTHTHNHYLISKPPLMNEAPIPPPPQTPTTNLLHPMLNLSLYSLNPVMRHPRHMRWL